MYKKKCCFKKLIRRFRMYSFRVSQFDFQISVCLQNSTV